LGQLLRELREDRRSYFGYLTYHLATALFFTGCRFHEWARLTLDQLVREPGGAIIAARFQVKGSSFRDLPLTKELADRSRNGSVSCVVCIKFSKSAVG
jgi:integrase